MFTIVWCHELFFMQQLIRYGIVGMVSNLTIYFVYLLITYYGVEPKTAMTFVFITGASIGFIGNRKWTFAHQGEASKAVRRFVISYAVAYVLNFSSMWMAVDRLGLPHYVVQAVNLIVISALLFMAQKYWIFSVNLANESNLSDFNSKAKKK